MAEISGINGADFISALNSVGGASGSGAAKLAKALENAGLGTEKTSFADILEALSEADEEKGLSGIENPDLLAKTLGMLNDSTGEDDFSTILTDAIDNSEALDDSANIDTFSILSGNTDNLSDVLINAKKSELALNLTVQLRNKAMDAYKEIMNMQV